MKRFALLIAVLTGLLASGCGGSATRSAADFTVEIYTPEYASGFDIRGRDKDAATLVTVRNPWQGAGNVEQHLLILREGAKAPAGLDAQVVKAPVRHVVCMSSSHVAMFDALGEVRRISGVSGIDYISNTYVNEHRYCGEVRDVGYDTNLNFELLASMRPDLVLLYGVTGENTVVTGKLRELGIPYIYIGDYMEESPLGKAEWLMVAAELCNVRDKGAETFRGIAARYNALKNRIAKAARSPRPKVMLNTPYRDTWFMPSSRSFMVRLIEDAGGEYRPGQYIRTQRDARAARRSKEEKTGRDRIWKMAVGAVLVLLFIYILYPRLADVFLRARTSAPAQTEAAGAEETVRRNGLDQSGISDVEWQEQPITVVPNDYQE